MVGIGSDVVWSCIGGELDSILIYAPGFVPGIMTLGEYEVDAAGEVAFVPRGRVLLERSTARPNLTAQSFGSFLKAALPMSWRRGCSEKR